MSSSGKSALYHTLMGSSSNKATTSFIMKGGARASLTNLFTILNERKVFLVKVLACLIVQLGITYYTMMNTTMTVDAKKYFALSMMLILVILVLALVPMSMPVKLLVFSGFSYLMGLLLSSIKKERDPKAIELAISSALGIFGAMFAVALIMSAFNVKIPAKMGLILLFALFALIIARLVTTITDTYSANNKALSFFGIMLFAIYVVYDTMVILSRDIYKGDFVTASMDYYLDIINLFVNRMSLSDN